MTTSFLCHTCNETHEGLPTDRAFQLPDEVWAVPEAERASRANWSRDLCDFDGRFFIRCILKIPFLELEGYYGWGVWVEVSEKDFYRYYELFSEDASSEPPVVGTVANDIPQYGTTLGLPVSVQFGNATSRPAVTASAGLHHPLAREQRAGMSTDRFHEILVATGSLGGP